MKYIKLFENFDEETNHDGEFVATTTAIPSSLDAAASVLTNHKVDVNGKPTTLYTVEGCEKDGSPCIVVNLVPFTAAKAGLPRGLYGFWSFYITEDGSITSEYDNKPGDSHKEESAVAAAEWLIDNVASFLSNIPK